MAYPDFTLSGLTKQFELRIVEDRDLFPDISSAALDPAFVALLREDAAMTLAISTEKARSEFIIALMLAELRRLCGRRIGLFSGVDFWIDAAAGLVGICDYIVTRSPEQLFVTAPVLMLVEAKNEDMKRGYAQCIAEMLAAQAFNARESSRTDRRNSKGRTMDRTDPTLEAWKKTKIAIEMERRNAEINEVFRRHAEKATPETVAAIDALYHEIDTIVIPKAQRQCARLVELQHTAEAQAVEIKRKAQEAAERGEQGRAEQLQREANSFEKTAELTRLQREQAEETLAQILDYQKRPRTHNCSSPP